MAISNILPRKIMKNRTRQQSMEERHDYDQKAEKTKDGELLSSYMCSPETAAEEFEISKRLYYQITGRSQPKGREIIMYRIIQSFKPEEVSPEEANQIAYELAMKFTGGQHQFVVATHVDKAHVHSHIEFNSTNLSCDGKFKNVKNSYLVFRRLNDELCRAHGLSVIENPKEKTKQSGETSAVKYGVSFKEQLRRTIDRVLPDCRDYEDFFERMRTEGYEIKQGKYLEFRASGQVRFTRSFRLGDAYTREALQERCTVRRGSAATPERRTQREGRKVNLLIDIQAKLDTGKGPGFERWAKIFNLKEAAKTLNFLIENGLTNYDDLTARVEQAEAEFDAASHTIKQLEARLSEVAQLKFHIIQYSKTRDIYAAYKRSRNKEGFLAEHAEEIALHEAAKSAFDALGGKPLPKVAQLSEQYAVLLAEKQAQYEAYRRAKDEMITFRRAKQNVDRILGKEQKKQERRQKQKPER